MKPEGMMYAAVALSATLSLGVLVAFFWSERRWRQWDREQAQRLRNLRTDHIGGENASPRQDDELAWPPIPFQRRPFHEALAEDCPELAPSPQARAIAQYLATRPANPETENDEMRWNEATATAAVMVGMLSGCHFGPPKPRLNPHPQERYEITMTIEDAPGPFTDIGGFVQYDVDNYEECMPEKWTFVRGHYHDQLDEFIPFAYTQIAENVYRTRITVDALRNVDYHGLGECRWGLTAVTSNLRGKNVDFIPRLHLDELRKQQAKRIYFSTRTYFAEKGYPDSGGERSEFGPEVQDELFTITLTPRRISP
ncbi:hypothetical protein [Lysobacter panacisoli]|uniref:Uncharacterized protein n=1 Tax=Lysobacter panacisoli TaxID=1255263 RepID=A0ABP9LIH7_9GAMM|nr:hypothetical protein [Lysobacter panacisoli]